MRVTYFFARVTRFARCAPRYTWSHQPRSIRIMSYIRVFGPRSGVRDVRPRRTVTRQLAFRNYQYVWLYVINKINNLMIRTWWIPRLETVDTYPAEFARTLITNIAVANPARAHCWFHIDWSVWCLPGCQFVLYRYRKWSRFFNVFIFRIKYVHMSQLRGLTSPTSRMSRTSRE